MNVKADEPFRRPRAWVRGGVGLLVLALAPRTAVLAQAAALTSDLWRIAAGTLVEPDAIASGGVAPFWTPAVILPATAPAARVGVETIHTQSDIGVNGGIAALAMRVGRLGTLHAVYGHIGLGDLVRTETSPEGLGGSIPVFADVLSLGAARRVAPAFVVGAAMRLADGRLADRERTQTSVDVGIQFDGVRRLRLGATTRFWDPTFGAAERGASYSLGGEYRAPGFPLWGTDATILVRYGITLLHGESPQHLLAGGLVLDDAFELDVGMAHEQAGEEAVVRSRFGLGVGAGRYRIVVARDSGVNGFGATYRFGLAATFR